MAGGTDGWSHVIGAPSRHVGSKTKPTDGHVLREGGLEKIPYCNLTPSYLLDFCLCKADVEQPSSFGEPCWGSFHQYVLFHHVLSDRKTNQLHHSLFVRCISEDVMFYFSCILFKFHNSIYASYSLFSSFNLLYVLP